MVLYESHVGMNRLSLQQSVFWNNFLSPEGRFYYFVLSQTAVVFISLCNIVMPEEVECVLYDYRMLKLAFVIRSTRIRRLPVV